MSYPAPLVRWGEFKLNALIVPLLQIIMFGMGTAMSARDFVGVVKAPRPYSSASAVSSPSCRSSAPRCSWPFLEPEIAAGIILIGSVPSGLASNVMAYIAKANLALSVTLTALTTLIAPFITPFYPRGSPDSYIPIDAWEMMWSIIKITILPIAAGLIFNHFLHGKTSGSTT